MDIFENIRKAIISYIVNIEPNIQDDFLNRITTEKPKDESHGDIATNAAFIVAKPLNMSSKEFAKNLAKDIPVNLKYISSAIVAGNGFVNFKIADYKFLEIINCVLKEKFNYGKINIGKGKKINLEFVSANPTGPLHIGHARGAVFGDVLARLLTFTGHKVTKEYYINDDGGQIRSLSRTARYRALEFLKKNTKSMDEDMYPGEYLIPTGRRLAQEVNTNILESHEDNWINVCRSYAITDMMNIIKKDLELLGVCHDIYTSEKEIKEKGKIKEVFSILKKNNLVYKGVLPPPKGKNFDYSSDSEPTLLFKSTLFGDDIDRALKKKDGDWTYFAADLAYHYNKWERGYKEMINVWGADHSGYVKRMIAAVKAITGEQKPLSINICQIVNLKEAGQPIKMSKREGKFITLNEVISKVGKDVTRFMMMTLKNDAPMDFDLVKAVEQSKDNPVFYVQYAYARISSIKRKCADEGIDIHRLNYANLKLLSHELEFRIIKTLSEWPKIIANSTKYREPHRIAFYLFDLSSVIHGYWAAGKENEELKIILNNNRELTQSRLALLEAARNVLAIGLDIFGVKPLEEM